MPRIPDTLEPVFVQFTEGPALVVQAIEGIDPVQLNRPGPGGWSVRDIVVHLSDAELMHALRFRMVLAEERPLLIPYDEQLWKKRLHYLWRSPEAALSLFQQTRFGSAELLQQCTLADWDRVAVHPTRGEQTLGDLLRRAASHALEHIEQIREMRGAR